MATKQQFDRIAKLVELVRDWKRFPTSLNLRRFPTDSCRESYEFYGSVRDAKIVLKCDDVTSIYHACNSLSFDYHGKNFFYNDSSPIKEGWDRAMYHERMIGLIDRANKFAIETEKENEQAKELLGHFDTETPTQEQYISDLKSKCRLDEGQASPL